MSFSPTAAAYAVDPAGESVEPSITAKVTHDLPVLQELWGVGGGSELGVLYVEAPPGVKAGVPLRVRVHGSRVDGYPFAGALVELSWQLGGKRYRDVTFTDAHGNVDVSRKVDRGCRGKPCVLAVRMRKDGLQALAYSTFIAR